MIVLDASALLAYLTDEPGAEVVEPLLDGAVIAAPNWSEVLQKLHQVLANPTTVASEILAVGVNVEIVDRHDAETAAALWKRHPHLSLGDRFCLAVAHRLEARVLTADSAWDALDVDLEVVQIRPSTPTR